ncbi:phage holin family protein [Haloechinothrix sp. LS1_15]|uniref:phage holin family protein n=1 Tax=Haloechinothrix sp. LS1_15 TaxID=2652248 RepID=UPI00294AA593|nr:phage holin family protein [Haloechinothrix sp. LS1_15]
MTQRSENDGAPNIPHLPLTEDQGVGGAAGSDQSIGSLVRDASEHVSTLVRAEFELAKSEVVGEVKKGVRGSVYFIIAGVIALYSSFFFFFFVGELLSEWLRRWASFGIVFLLMLLTAGAFAYLGYRKVRKLKAPERTIDSVRETAATLRRGQEHHPPEEVPADAVGGYRPR